MIIEEDDRATRANEVT